MISMWEITTSTDVSYLSKSNQSDQIRSDQIKITCKRYILKCILFCGALKKYICMVNKVIVFKTSTFHGIAGHVYKFFTVIH